MTFDEERVRSVAIIGGGASGAICLDSLVQEECFDKIYLFERRNTFGGIWCLDETPKTSSSDVSFGYSPTDMDPQLNNPFSKGEINGSKLMPKSKERKFSETPSYEGLTTNIPENLMTFSDANKWDPDSSSEFVERSVVRDYIERYIKRNVHKRNVQVLLNSSVEDVEKQGSSSELERNCSPYILTIKEDRDLKNELWYRVTVDAIIVATGHYNIPYIPPIPGLHEVKQKFPQVVRHAKFFRSAKDYENKSVIIVGSRASGSDIVSLVSKKSKTVYHSIRNKNRIRISENSRIREKSEIQRFESIKDDKFKVIFTDGSEIINPDHVIFGTGYQFSYSFLRRFFQSLNKEWHIEGEVVLDQFMHTFSIHEKRICFVGIPIDGISFRVFEFQAVLVSRYLSGKINLPSYKKQLEWRNRRLYEKGKTRQFHTIGIDDAFHFLSDLAQLGHINVGPGYKGRQFPTISTKDMQLLKEKASRLRKFWDQN